MAPIAGAALIASIHCGGNGAIEVETRNTMELSTPEFHEGGNIPAKFTCDGLDVSPRLAWLHVPQGAKSLALVCDDPDAPMGTWVHWVLYAIPPRRTSLPEGVPHDSSVAGIGLQGRNDFGKIGYGGPCPPPGRPHRYLFRLYALDTGLKLSAGAKRADLEKAMKGHVLAEGRLLGKYGR